jgi:hypothetical protein
MDERIKKRQHGSAPGERRGGRVRGSISKSTFDILQKSQAMDADPLAVHLQIIGCNGALKLPQIDPATGKQAVDGQTGELLYTWTVVTLTERIASCRAIMNFLYPKLMRTKISGPENGAVQVTTFDITQLLNDPALAKEAQRMALMLCDQQDPNAPNGAPAVPYDTGLVPIKMNRHE